MVGDFVKERQLGGIRKNGDFDGESYDALLELAPVSAILKNKY